MNTPVSAESVEAVDVERPQGGSMTDRDWTFVTTARWIISHAFVGTVVLGCFAAALWQYNRLGEVRSQNEVIEERANQQPVALDSLVDREPSALDYLPVEDRGRWLDPQVVLVSNRSQNSLGGDWVVGLFETNAGVKILVNRGFVTFNGEIAPPPDLPEISGWLQQSQTKDSYFGVVDAGDAERAPRLEVQRIAERLDVDTASGLLPVWLQLRSPSPEVFPDPVPLPELSEGNHLSYTFQWAVFGLMTIPFYYVILNRRAKKDELEQRRKRSEAGG